MPNRTMSLIISPFTKEYALLSLITHKNNVAKVFIMSVQVQEAIKIFDMESNTTPKSWLQNLLLL